MEMIKKLLELAESFDGIVDTFYCKGECSANGLPKQQFYNYLIIIDFESTCWEKSEIKWRQPEIIGRTKCGNIFPKNLLTN